MRYKVTNARWEERDSEVDVSGEEEGGEEKNREKPEEEEEEEEEGGGRSFFSFAIRTIPNVVRFNTRLVLNDATRSRKRETKSCLPFSNCSSSLTRSTDFLSAILTLKSISSLSLSLNDLTPSHIANPCLVGSNPPLAEVDDDVDEEDKSR